MSRVADLMDERPDDWLAVLQADYKIKVVRDGDLVSLKYDQAESPMHLEIVQECRGMVVHVPERRIMARPYDKFWNLGEPLAAEIDWATARFQEKLDGSLMIMYWGVGGWRVASSGHPTAGGMFGADARTFATAFADAWLDLGYKLPPTSRAGITFLFELCAAANRVVVKHDKPRIVLHGARHLSGVYLDHKWCEEIAAELGWEHVQSFPIATLDECLALAAVIDPLRQEGYVVVDAQHRRLKIKSPRYVMLHRLKGEMSTYRAVELWRFGEASELLAHFPEFAGEVQVVHDALDAIADQAMRDWWAHTPAASRKEFALAVKELPTAPILFKLIGVDDPTVADAKAIMRRMATSALERMLG